MNGNDIIALGLGLGLRGKLSVKFSIRTSKPMSCGLIESKRGAEYPCPKVRADVPGTWTTGDDWRASQLFFKNHW